jgi:methylated-DNA-[protein]-cysteine S-methyltransferase
VKSYISFLKSPLGTLKITSSAAEIFSVSFVESDWQPTSYELPPIHQLCKKQLDDYFHDKLTGFSLAISGNPGPGEFIINPEGTEFQKKVWRALLDIPRGATTSYMSLAENLGDPLAIRAIASAIGNNKIAVIIPCHRVIGSDGTMVGFASGIPRKEWLLHHEGAIPQLRLFNQI